MSCRRRDARKASITNQSIDGAIVGEPSRGRHATVAAMTSQVQCPRVFLSRPAVVELFNATAARMSACNAVSSIASFS